MENKVINGLRWFNDFKDEFLIELSSIFLMLGFVAGTVDILSSQFGLSGIQWFNAAWSIVQAIAIDGLFFAVWSRVRDTPWSTQKVHKLWYGFIGILLAAVASLVNNILSYQELNHIPVVAVAMDQLHINQAVFSYTRSFLVVIVSILVATFPREKKSTAEGIDQVVTQVAEEGMTQELQSIRSIVEELRSTVEVLQSTKSTKAIAREKKSIPLVDAPKEQKEEATEQSGVDQEVYTIDQDGMESIQVDRIPAGYMATDDGDTLRAVDDQGRSMVATGGYRDMIKEAMLQNPGRRYQDIANNLGIALATVKKHGRSIKQEIAGQGES